MGGPQDAFKSQARMSSISPLRSSSKQERSYGKKGIWAPLGRRRWRPREHLRLDTVAWPRPHATLHARPCHFLQHCKGNIVNRIIWLVGLVVIVLFIAGYFGFRW